MKAWLKGGLIGGVIGTIIFALAYWNLTSGFINVFNVFNSPLYHIFALSLMAISSSINFGSEVFKMLIIGGFLYSLFSFLIGAFIGWMIGKVKSRKQGI